jgi:hypothetical protein
LISLLIEFSVTFSKVTKNGMIQMGLGSNGFDYRVKNHVTLICKRTILTMLSLQYANTS